jgi:hypothetical protein
MIFFEKSLVPLTYAKSSMMDWLSAIEEVLYDNFFANTWSVERGSARRVVFAFPKNLYISWVYSENSDNDNLKLQIWEDKTYDKNISTQPYPSPNGFGEWNQETKTWDIENATPKVVHSVLKQTRETFGEATICLPWEGFLMESGVEEIADLLENDVPFFYALGKITDSQKEVIEQFLIDYYDEEEKPLALPCMVALQKEAIVSPQELGNASIEIGLGDTWLPTNSPLHDFLELVQDIQELPDWIVVWDECCAACSHSSIKFIAEEKNISEVSPSIILWGQNAQYQYLADGTVSVSLYLDDESVQQLEPILSKYGDIPGMSLY